MSSSTISAFVLISSSSLIKRTTTITNLYSLFLKSKTPPPPLTISLNKLTHPLIVFSLSSPNDIPEYPGKGPPEFPSVPSPEPPSFPKEDPVVPTREPAEIDPAAPPEIGTNDPPQFNPNPSPKPVGPIPPLSPPGQDTPIPNPDVVPPRPPDVVPPRPPGPEIVPPPNTPPELFVMLIAGIWVILVMMMLPLPKNLEVSNDTHWRVVRSMCLSLEISFLDWAKAHYGLDPLLTSIVTTNSMTI